MLLLRCCTAERETEYFFFFTERCLFLGDVFGDIVLGDELLFRLVAFYFVFIRQFSNRFLCFVLFYFGVVDISEQFSFWSDFCFRARAVCISKGVAPFLSRTVFRGILILTLDPDGALQKMYMLKMNFVNY